MAAMTNGGGAGVNCAGPWRIVASEYEPVLEVPAQIRRQLRRVLGDWNLGEDVIGDALLVVEELVSNVVDHAHTPFQLHVRLDEGCLRLAVHDDAPGDLRVLPPAVEWRRGQGLRIVAGLSRRWGCEAEPIGKTVRAELDT